MSALSAFYLALLIIAVTAKTEPTAQQRALSTDPMGAFVPAGTKVLRTRSLPESKIRGRHSTPRAASLLRFFTVPKNDGQRVLADTIARAQATGWTIRSRTPGVSVGLAKQLPTGPVALSIWLVDNQKTAAGWDLPNPFFEVLLSYDDWRFHKFGLALSYR